MNSDMQQQILNRLDALAAKLGVAAKELFALYVKQVLITGWEAIVTGAVCYVVLVVCLRGMWNVTHKDLGPYDDPIDKPVFWFSLIFGLFGIIAGTSFLVNGVDLVLNPQLWAFKEVLSNIK